MATRDANERRLRLGVWAGFRLPDLGFVPAEPVEHRVDAVYYDTPDLRLLRRGVTVRADADGWSVRRVAPPGEPLVSLTADSGDVAEAGEDGRDRLGGPGAGEVPAEIVAVTVAWALGAPLGPVARVATVRQAIALRDGDREVALLADDEVLLLRGERVAARFRELDLTLLDGAAPRVLAALGRRLREAGAQPIDPVPKLVRGLAPAALEPPAPAVPAAGPGASAADAIRTRLGGSFERWIGQHAPLLLEGTPASVRGLRSAARALRRDLRLFTPLVDARAGLGWLVDALTPVRRLDQLLELVDEQPALRERLESERADALATSRRDLRQPRYAALLEHVASLVERPPLPSRAGRPASDVLPRLVREPLQRVRRASGDDPERLRKLVDRLATATGAAAPYADAQRAETELAELRTLLRELHRAGTAIDALHALAARAPEHAWAAGLLAGRESVRAAECREALPYALTRATRRKLWTWVP
jgi:inorganic triphosphatase YgiF